MYQSKLHTKHNKNLLALVCLGMLWLLCACLCKWGCVCRSVCVVLLCKSANTPRCQLADIKARESFFIVMSPCWGVELGICIEHGWQQRSGRGWWRVRRGVVRIVKPHVWQHVWHTITRAAERKATFVTQNKMAVRPFSLISSWGRSSASPSPHIPLGAFAWIIIFAFLMRSQQSFKHFYIEIFISKAKMRTKRTCPVQKATAPR